MNEVNVKEITDHCLNYDGSRRFRLEGPPSNQEWNVRPGKEPWCEASVTPERYSDGRLTGEWYVSSFTGELWPSAWPEIFASYQTNCRQVSDYGKQLLGL